MHTTQAQEKLKAAQGELEQLRTQLAELQQQQQQRSSPHESGVPAVPRRESSRRLSSSGGSDSSVRASAEELQRLR